jgi:hypothetical protein
MDRFKSRPGTFLIALYAIFGGATFFLIQTSKLLRPVSAGIEMVGQPLGLFNWGYVWSDTLVAGPTLLIGGILLLSSNRYAQRLGRLLAFTGFMINLYAMICLWTGFWAIGQPMHGAELWTNVALTFLGILCAIELGIQAVKDETGTG